MTWVCCLCVTLIVSSVTNRLVWLLQGKRIISVRVEFYTVTLAIAYSINYVSKRYIFTLVMFLMPY